MRGTAICGPFKLFFDVCAWQRAGLSSWGLRVKPVEAIEFDLKPSRGYQVDRAKPSQAQSKISRYTKNKVLFSVPCVYVREVVIFVACMCMKLFFASFGSLCVRVPPQLSPLNDRFGHPHALIIQCLVLPSVSSRSGIVLVPSSPPMGNRSPKRKPSSASLRGPESWGNRHFFRKSSRLFRENFLFIGKNGVYYSFTHTILRST